MDIDDKNFLHYLSENHPYLYDLEMSVRKIQNATGFGEASISVRIIEGKADKGQIFGTEEKVYRHRINNRLL